MRALAVAELGRLDTVALGDFSLPEPGEGEVRLKVEAVGLGWVDRLIAEGGYQLKPAVPYVPGAEIVGTVDRLGPGVTGFAAGDRVAIWQLARGGGVAEYALTLAENLVLLPARLQPVDAAALILDYLTAYYALFDRGQLRPGETVLVLGAAGGVAAAAVQLAKRAGARVIAAASSAVKRDRAIAFGADAVVDYGAADWRGELRGLLAGGAVDVVVDPVGGAASELAFRSLGKGGRHLVLGFAAGAIPAIPTNLPLLKNASLIGVDARYLFESDLPRAREIWTELFDRADRGEIGVPDIEPVPLSRAADALSGLMRRDSLGKRVIVVTDQR